MTDRPAGCLEAAAAGVEAMLTAGATDAEVFLRDSMVHRATAQGGTIVTAEGTRVELALRAWCAGRQAIVSTDRTDPAQLRRLAVRVTGEARHRGVPATALLTNPPRATPATSSRTPNGPVAGLGEPGTFLAALLAAISTRVGGSLNAVCVATDQVRAIANSRGLLVAQRGTDHRAWCWLEGSAGHVTLAAAGCSAAELDAEDIAERLAEQASLLGRSGDRVPAGEHAVLFPPRAAADLARAFGQLLAGENLSRDLAPLLDRIGRRIGSQAVTLIDDATLPGRPGTRSFDDEAVPTERTVLVDAGRLTGFLHTLATADRVGAQPNGKAHRPSVWDQPRSAPSNIHIAPGDASPTELADELTRGLRVAGLQRPGRLHGSTGRFTAVAHGWWHEPGRDPVPVSGVPLSGTPFAMLRAIRRCATDLQFSPLSDGAGGPTVLITGVRIG